MLAKKNDKLAKCIPNRFLFQKIFFTINLTFYDHSNLCDRDLILLFILSVTYEESMYKERKMLRDQLTALYGFAHFGDRPM